MHYYTHEELDGATRASLNGFARTIKLHGRSKMKVNELRDALRKRLPPREGTSPGLFVELCAGTAALSLRLHKEGAKPPVSRMGSKTGYANVILHELGLYPGLKADRYLWCEPDDGCRLLLTAYTDAGLRAEAAKIIRGWAGEEPRALWERLRAEGPVKVPPVDPREVARWCLSAACAMRGNPDAGYAIGEGCNTVWAGGSPQNSTAARLSTLPTLPATILPDARAVDPREVARWCYVSGAAYRRGDPRSGFDAAHERVAKGEKWGSGDPRDIAPPILSALPTLPATICPDARAVDPREVARWTHLMAAGAGILGSYYNPEHLGGGGWVTAPPETTARRVEDLPTIPGEITDGAVEPPLLPPNTVVYIDPPYVNTTGYKHDLGRDRVVELALAWHAAGATVCISEQEAIPELVAQGWRSVDITGKRQGSRRTFSVQKTEYLTISPETPC